MDIIGIHSAPRSGSSWLGCIFDSSPVTNYHYQPFFSFEFKDKLSNSSSIEEILDFFKLVHGSENEFTKQIIQKKENIIPSFIKKSLSSHLIYKSVRYHNLIENILEKLDSGIKIIFLVRDPRSVLLSWKNAPKEFRKDLEWVFETEWRFALHKNQDKLEEYNGYEKWKEANNLFLKLNNLYPEKTRIVLYNELLKNTDETVEKLFDFAQLKITKQTKEFLLNSLHNEHKYSVFKSNKKNDKNWVIELEKSIAEFIENDLNNSSLKKFLDG